jgi:hypothetical protein
MKAYSLGLFAAVAAATDLLIPFYQYPSDQGAAWNEIFWSLGNNTDLTHTLVIGPNNSKGARRPTTTTPPQPRPLPSSATPG